MITSVLAGRSGHAVPSSNPALSRSGLVTGAGQHCGSGKEPLTQAVQKLLEVQLAGT